MKNIGPILQVPEDYVPRMQDAIETDTEAGAHWLSNHKAEEINRLCPTILAMAALIEKERDELMECFNATEEYLDSAQLCFGEGATETDRATLKHAAMKLDHCRNSFRALRTYLKDDSVLENGKCPRCGKETDLPFHTCHDSSQS